MCRKPHSKHDQTYLKWICDTFTYWAQGFQTFSNPFLVSFIILAIYSCTIIHEMFCLAWDKDTVGVFCDLMIVILAAKSIKNTNLADYQEWLQ